MSMYCVSCDKELDKAIDSECLCYSCLQRVAEETRCVEPAFPQTVVLDNTMKSRGGLTKREWFAGMALQGLCVNGYYMSTEDRLNLAMSAYQLADAMLKEGAK